MFDRIYRSYWKGGESKLTDLVNAATTNKIKGSGAHPPSYYRKYAGFRSMEPFADIIALVGGSPFSRTMVEKFAPHMWAVVKEEFGLE